MKKKLQVFVSSTYIDLRQERQAVVEAILKAGHIPAGMELFAAGDKSQMDTIRRWIDESDVFMLVLGGRYGSIDPDTKKSYTELEYDYAWEKKKPNFAAVITDAYLARKVLGDGGSQMTEADNPALAAFRTKVKGKIVSFFNDVTELKLIVHESINQIVQDTNLPGWVRGDELPDPKPMIEEMARLRSENARLTTDVAALSAKMQEDKYGEHEFGQLLSYLRLEIINVPQLNLGIPQETLLNLFLRYADTLTLGLDDRRKDGPYPFLYYSVAPKLAIYGLMDKDIGKFTLSQGGRRFLAKVKPMWLTWRAAQRTGPAPGEPPGPWPWLPT